MSDASIRGEGLRYAPDGVPLVDGLDVAFVPGTVTALVGPSGCGKSTLLRLLAGLRPLDGGRIVGVPARKAFVFQDPALLPWLPLRENVALPGRFGPIGDVGEAIARVGLAGHEDKLPAQLSGGQRMRASLARALVARPEIVFLDEPFSALDGVTRASVQKTFSAFQQEFGWTVLLVTHELEEAVRLSDRVLAVGGPPLNVLADMPMTLPRPRDPRDPAAPPLVAKLVGLFQPGPRT